MTKVLFIAHFREPTGWGQAARDYILAMDSVGIDVVPRCINVGPPVEKLPQRIIELEKKSSEGCDVCIQHLLPHYMEYDGHFRKNIAMYYTESTNMIYTNWPDKINCMDEAWVANSEMHFSGRKSGVKIPIKIVHPPTDVTKFEKTYKPLTLPDVADNFVFYFIGELTRRKNVVALLKAFHTEFLPSEPVSLVIKTNKSGLTPQQVEQNINETCRTVKEQLKLYPKDYCYKEEIIITQRLTEDEMGALHQACDCFVMPSFGEGWCIPAMDALGFGNPVIASDVGGLIDFVHCNNGSRISGQDEPIFGMTDTFSWLSTGKEEWFNINVCELKTAMRGFYNHRHILDSGYRISARETVNKFSYNAIGTQIKELLND